MKIKNLIMGILILAGGLVLLISPQFCMKFLVVVVGLFAVVNGVYNLIQMPKISANDTYKKTVIIKNLVSVVIGVLAVIFPFALMKTFASIWTVIAYLLAIGLVVFAVTGFVSASMLNSENGDIKKHITSESFICILIAILMFIVPISSFINAFFRIIGAVALLIGLAICALEISKKVMAGKKSSSDIVVEAEVKDEEPVKVEDAEAEKSE